MNSVYSSRPLQWYPYRSHGLFSKHRPCTFVWIKQISTDHFCKFYWDNNLLQAKYHTLSWFAHEIHKIVLVYLLISFNIYRDSSSLICCVLWPWSSPISKVGLFSIIIERYYWDIYDYWLDTGALRAINIKTYYVYWSIEKSGVFFKYLHNMMRSSL